MADWANHDSARPLADVTPPRLCSPSTRWGATIRRGSSTGTGLAWLIPSELPLRSRVRPASTVADPISAIWKSAAPAYTRAPAAIPNA